MEWFIVFLLFLFSCPSYAQRQVLTAPQYGEGQAELKEHYSTTTLENGEVAPWFLIPEVHIIKNRAFADEEAKKQYLRLRRNVYKVLPYANFAQKRYDQLDRELALSTDKREQKRLVQKCEDEIKAMFNKEVKDLSITQGKILIKLIDRQTGQSSYDMVKELKGGMTAFMYQGVAKVFGHNLKSTYDPKEDFEIENIVREYERARRVIP